MSPIGTNRHVNRFSSLVCLAGFFLVYLLFLVSCSPSDVNSKNSITSGTTTGSGSSGNAAATVTVTPASNPIGNGATTTLTVIVTDAQGRRTDASLIVTSNGGGTFSGGSTTSSGGTTTSTGSSSVNANTFGGILVITFTPSAAGDIEIVASVPGTSVRGSLILNVS